MSDDRAAFAHCVDSARAVLERIVSRLEPMERELSFVPGYWVGGKAEAAARQRLANGLYFLRIALRDARDALASDDPENIIISAINCQTAFGDGRLLLFRREEVPHLSRERGKKSGAVRRYPCKCYQDAYKALLNSGIPYLRARQECIARMIADGLKPPKSPTTENAWFPKPEKISN